MHNSLRRLKRAVKNSRTSSYQQVTSILLRDISSLIPRRISFMWLSTAETAGIYILFVLDVKHL